MWLKVSGCGLKLVGVTYGYWVWLKVSGCGLRLVGVP